MPLFLEAMGYTWKLSFFLFITGSYFTSHLGGFYCLSKDGIWSAFECLAVCHGHPCPLYWKQNCLVHRVS